MSQSFGPGLMMVGLGVLGDAPENSLQPPLQDGIHLRWAFQRDLGFPWYGFYLFRRTHRPGTPISLQPVFAPYPPGFSLGRQANLAGIGVSSDADILVSDHFPPPGGEFELSGRHYLDFRFSAAQPARRVVVRIGVTQDSSVRAQAFWGSVPVDTAAARPKAGQNVTLELAADLVTSVRLTGCPGAVIDFAYVPASQEATPGWEPVPGFTYPLCLPVAQAAYPCSGKPSTRAAAEQMALGRVVYGPSSAWGGQNFADLHGRLEALVKGGPTGPAMSGITEKYTGVPATAALKGPPPEMPAQYPLDLVLVASLHPALAQALGLYWVDAAAEPGKAYDYLIVGDWQGALAGRIDDILVNLCEGPANLAGFVTYNLVAGPTKPLAAPQKVRAYALPGFFVPSGSGEPTGKPIDAQSNAGLRWELGQAAPGLLRPGSAIMYHLWRHDTGSSEPAQPVPGHNHQLLTGAGPVMVIDPTSLQGKTPERPSDWPPFAMHAIDRGLKDGWYSYRVSGIDIYGRHSPLSQPAQWWQWAKPGGDRMVKQHAIQLLDKVAPPCPTGVEAYALDPADLMVLEDDPYKAWRKTLSATEAKSVVGLRVRWRWTAAHRAQAPDTKEFRVYYRFRPNAKPPNKTAPALPDLGNPANWDKRVYVVPYDKHYKEVSPAGGSGGSSTAATADRLYEVFLPASGDADRTGLPLLPTQDDPIVYAHIGVTAADDKTHTGDLAKWSAATWGKRTGNESTAGGPVLVVRVLRTPPDPPSVPADSEKVWASPADYHGHSFYTYRWKPKQNLKVHVFRALDETLFRVDWTRRVAAKGKSAVSAQDMSVFPDANAEPRWDAAKRSQVAGELNTLNTFAGGAAGATGSGGSGGKAATPSAQALAYYRKLSNDALRVLAGLPGNEEAFSQVTVEPLDPTAPACKNQRGPDNPADFKLDASLRAYVDTLDGASTNRYFFRAAYVDGAHNPSSLSLSGPPVWPPNVVPPRAPVFTGAVPDDRKVTVKWSSNREDDLSEYRLYRSYSSEDARDIRLMTLVRTEAVAAGVPESRPAEVSYTDSPVQGLVSIFYRLVAVDEAGNVSAPSAVLEARAFDESGPSPPTWQPASAGPNPGEVKLAWSSPANDLSCMVERQVGGSTLWEAASGWLSRGTYTYTDTTRQSGLSYTYRLRVKDTSGRLNRSFVSLQA